MSPGTCSDSDEQMEGGHDDIRQEMRGEGVGRGGEGRGEKGRKERSGRGGEGRGEKGREGEGRGEEGREGSNCNSWDRKVRIEERRGSEGGGSVRSGMTQAMWECTYYPSLLTENR